MNSERATDWVLSQACAFELVVHLQIVSNTCHLHESRCTWNSITVISFFSFLLPFWAKACRISVATSVMVDLFVWEKHTLQAGCTLERAPDKNVELERVILLAVQHLDDEAILSNRLLTRGEQQPRPKKTIKGVRRILYSSRNMNRARIYHTQKWYGLRSVKKLIFNVNIF